MPAAAARTVVVKARTIVVKVGTSSITDERGRIVEQAIVKLCREVAEVRSAGDQVVVVTSGAVASGLPVLGLHPRPNDPAILQAISAVGQSRLMGHYDRALAAAGLVGGQVLLAPLDFWDRASTCTAPKRSGCCSAWASSPWSTKMTPSPTTRSVSATMTGWRRWSPTCCKPICSSC